MNLKEKGVFVFCVLHLPLNNGYHNYIASSLIAPRIFNQQELILFQGFTQSEFHPRATICSNKYVNKQSHLSQHI